MLGKAARAGDVIELDEKNPEHSRALGNLLSAGLLIPAGESARPQSKDEESLPQESPAPSDDSAGVRAKRKK